MVVCGRVGLLGALVGLLPLPASAQTPEQPQAAAQAPAPSPTYSLSWVRAEGAEACPNAATLTAEVERRLGRVVFQASAQRSIEVDVTRFADRYRSDVYVRDAAGQALGHRQLESAEPGCGALVSATALAVALVIDPEAASREPARAPAAASFEAPPAVPVPAPPASAPTASGEGAPACQEPPPAKPAAVEIVPPRSVAAVSLRGTYSRGLVPTAAPGAELVFAGRWLQPWGLALSASYVSSRGVSGGIGALDVGLTRASLLLTYDVAQRARSPLFWLGFGPSVGAYHVGVRKPAPVTDAGDFPYLAVEARAELQLPVTQAVFVAAGASGSFTPWRQGFWVRGQQAAVWRQSTLAGSAFLGLGLAFP